MKNVTDHFNTVYDATFRELTRLSLLKAPADDAHDLLQNAYAKYFSLISRRGRDAVRDPKAYLVKVLKHEIAHYHRRRARLATLPLDAAENEPSDENVEELGINYAAAEEIVSALEDEPELTRRIFLLAYGYGMKLGDIADGMGLTEAAVRSRLARARNRIRIKLKEEKEQ